MKTPMQTAAIMVMFLITLSSMGIGFFKVFFEPIGSAGDYLALAIAAGAVGNLLMREWP